MTNKTKLIFKHSIIAGFLFLLWPILTFFYIVTGDISFSILSYNHSKENITRIPEDELYKGKKIIGNFTAKENNLGIVALRLSFDERVPYRLEDKVVFRIKEKGAKDWYYQNQYRGGLIYDVPFFPFGFPIIEHSKDKTYVFELESLSGNVRNAMAFNPREPVLASKYQVSTASLKQEPSQMAQYLYKKFVNAFQAVDVIFMSFIVFLPFLFYCLWIFSRYTKSGKELNGYIRFFGLKSKRLGPAVYTSLILIGFNILFLQLTDSLVYIVLSLLWIFVLRLGKRSGRLSFYPAFFLLAITPFPFYLGNFPIAEYAAVWAFLFFFIGFVSLLLEGKKIPFLFR